MTCYCKAIFFYGSAFVVVIFLALCIILIATSHPYPIIRRTKKEKHFFDPTTNQYIPFAAIDDDSSINLSVIIPAYDEEVRLPPMLDECIEFLETRRKTSNFTYEIIVVSDGSKDDTVKVATTYVEKYGSDLIKVMDLEKNRGKGGAVRLGMYSAKGAVLLFADADGATKFGDLVKLESSLQQIVKDDYLSNPQSVSERHGIVIGSRAHLEDEAIATRSFFRTILMYGFHFLVWLFAVRGLRDTQCGFKLLTREATRVCFASMHVERWAFDVELLYIAQRLKIPIKEVSVNWTEIEGSKVTPFWSWVQMGKDLGLIWLRYKIGAWKLCTIVKNKDA